MGYTNYWSINKSKKKFTPYVLGKVEQIVSAYTETTNEKLVKTAGSERMLW